MSGDELIDVVDENDHVVRQATRREVRQGRLRHRSVYIFVFNPNGQLFVHRRTETKDIFPGYWDVAVGGVLGAGETYDHGAQREFAEELGITGVVLRRLFPLRYDDETNHVCGMVYSCTVDCPVRLQAAEIAEGEWLDLATVLERTQRSPFCPDGLEALRLYLAKLEAARARR
jgi:isopentenyl-diphosphate delta-isomerase